MTLKCVCVFHKKPALDKGNAITDSLQTISDSSKRFTAEVFLQSEGEVLLLMNSVEVEMLRFLSLIRKTFSGRALIVI